MRAAAKIGEFALPSPARATRINVVDNAVLVIAVFIPAATHSVAKAGGIDGNIKVSPLPKAAPAQNRGKISGY